MKKILITFIALSFLFSSCKKWLDVKPQGKTTQEELFKTQKGFRDALTGAYIRMKGSNIYGGALMWGNIEYMAGNWYNTNNNFTSLTKLINGDYTDQGVLDMFDNTYRDLYKVIADANAILGVIDDKKTVFTAGNYEITKGEALALRAFCHFDAIRMYGPIPSNPGTSLTLPYVTRVSKDINQPLSYAQFMQSVLTDLNQAEDLLKNTDPILKYSIAQLNPGQNDIPALDDNYLQYRQLRMNYYAILALKARVYLWLSASDAGAKVNAAKYANMVVNAVDQTGKPTFRLGVEADRVAQDYTMTPEHIMALSVYDLENTARNTFGDGGSLLRYDLTDSYQYYYLNSLFPVAERTADIRWKDMWSYKTSSGNQNYVMYNKFIQKPGNLALLQVPLLRLSEMYFILTECATSKTEAENFYKIYCSNKGVPFTSFNSDWETDRKNKIIREYVREFYAEGQSFFTFKRFNLTTLPTNWTGTFFYNVKASKYLVPKPTREINYNNN